jgi:hypothetical protein
MISPSTREDGNPHERGDPLLSWPAVTPSALAGPIRRGKDQRLEHRTGSTDSRRPAGSSDNLSRWISVNAMGKTFGEDYERCRARVPSASPVAPPRVSLDRA